MHAHICGLLAVVELTGLLLVRSSLPGIARHTRAGQKRNLDAPDGTSSEQLQANCYWAAHASGMRLTRALDNGMQ